MSELSPRARALVHSGRGAVRATDADRARIQDALRARLGAAALPLEAGNASPLARPRWQLVSSALVGAGVVGGALLLAFRHEPGATSATRTAPAAPIAAAASAAPVSAPTPAAAEPAVDLPAPVASAEPAAPAARPAQDRLAQEVALLARATSALHAGHAVDALKILDEYQRKFPNGLLTEERRAAKAQALCSLGRWSEGQAELAHLAPQSPAAARAKQVCSASSSTNR